MLRLCLYGLGMPIDNIGIKDTLCDCFIRIILQETAVIATPIPLMTCRFAVLYHPNEQTILLTIHENIPHFLNITRLFPFAPDRISRTAKEVGIAHFASQVEGFFVHESYHKHFTCSVVLDDSGYQTLAVKFQHISCPHSPLDLVALARIESDCSTHYTLPCQEYQSCQSSSRRIVLTYFQSIFDNKANGAI